MPPKRPFLVGAELLVLAAGLKVEAEKGPVGVLVVDRVERPSEN